MNRIKDFFRTFLLFELLKGMMLTGRYLFARKITVQFPEEKTPQSPRFRGLHALRRYPNGKDAALPANFVKRYVPLSQLRSNPSSVRMARAAPNGTTSISPNAYSVDFARNHVPSIPLSKREF